MRSFILFLSIFLLGSVSLTAQEGETIRVPCISIIGDSLAYGTQVVELRGTDYVVMQTTPFSYFLDESLRKRAYLQVAIYDLSLAETSLMTGSYQSSENYQISQDLDCGFAIIFPWINDLASFSISGDTSNYTSALLQFVFELTSNNPQTQFVLLNYYTPQPTDVGKLVYETSFMPETTAALNLIHGNVCGAVLVVRCYELDTVLAPIEDYLSFEIPKSEIDEYGYRATNEAGQAQLSAYFQRFPNGLAYSDGVHLNHDGKQLLADEILNLLESLNPNFFQILPIQQ